MKTKNQLTALILSGVIVLASVLTSAPPALAVEGALGRPISGAAIAPFAAVIPPEPGFAVAVGEAYYPGSISGSVPLGNFTLNLGIEMTASFTPLAVFYIWPTECKQWNFASTMSLPLAYVEVEANVSLGRFNRKETDHNFGLFDIVVTPIIASYHISKTDHVAFTFTFWAPTGDYDPNRLAVLSLNNWTFIPGLAYTKIFPKPDIELSSIWQLQFYTENPATRYQNGILSDFEVMGIKRFKNGFGIGAIFGWIDQITDDTGPGGDRLHGYQGRALGIGPIITYSTKVGKSHLDFSARYIPEFGNERRVEGNNFQFSASLKF